MKRENVLLFVKPFKENDDERGNPFALDIITDMYRLGCEANRVKVMKLTPKMLIKHYDELMREGRQHIVYDMVGDYVCKDLSKKLLDGKNLSEEEMNRPGKTVFVFDMLLPETFVRHTTVKDSLNLAKERATEVVDGTIGNFRKYAVGPTRYMSYFQMVEKVEKDNPGMTTDKVYAEAMNQYIPASNSIRYQYQYAGAKGSFNVMHCSANSQDRDYEIGNFFGEWGDAGIVLDANKVNNYFSDRCSNTKPMEQADINSMINRNDANHYFDYSDFILNPVDDIDNIND